MATNRVEVTVEGRELSLSNLDKVLYPEAGTTKSEVIEYLARIAPALLPHTRGRCMTLRRFPNGVDGTSFFEKRCPDHRPDWVPTAPGPGDEQGHIGYCLLEEPAALVWTANLAALELHAPMALAEDLDRPAMVVFDLDPGPGTAMRECARVGLMIRAMLDRLGLVAFPKTSGSKGLQLYLPLNTPVTHEEAAGFARAVGMLLEREHPRSITTTMAKSERPGRIFVDWSQNNRHKTTVCVYSLRARPRPTVSTPVSWAEVEVAAEGETGLVFEFPEVLERVERLGDLFAEVLTLHQRLPIGPAEDDGDGTPTSWSGGGAGGDSR